MAQRTIEWTGTPRADGTIAPGYTFNPWTGCEKVSAGCANCYAEALWDKRYKKVIWGKHGTRVRTTPDYWRQPLKWQRACEAAGERRKVFCASLADVFEGRSDLVPWRKALWRIIEQTPALDWLLLTKRPENVRLMYPRKWLNTPPRNVWIGTSVENQATCNLRLLTLLKVPAVRRFLSCEPLINPVKIGLAGTLPKKDFPGYLLVSDRLHWVIAGGESGDPAYDRDGEQIAPRVCRVEWIEALRDECLDAGVPFFNKQLGARPLQHQLTKAPEYFLDLADKKGGAPAEWAEALRVRQWPKGFAACP